MVKKKLIRFAENFTFTNLFQQSYDELMTGFPLKGHWNENYFRNWNPITVELGCGKGEYTVNLAKTYPGRNFIGIDIKGARMWKGCKTATLAGLGNVAFIRSRIELITHFFDAGEVDEIWITFPDPQPQHSRVRKRLTAPIFLERYRNVLRPGGTIHLKTDNDLLYEYTLGIIAGEKHELKLAVPDLYGSGYAGDAVSVRTFYEEMFLKEGATIKYIQFSLGHGQG